MQQAHKIRLYPNNRQSTYLARCCGVARFAYNWGLAKWNEQYELHKASPDSVASPNQCRYENGIRSPELSVWK